MKLPQEKGEATKIQIWFIKRRIRTLKNTKVYKGFFLNDEIVFDNKVGWISGFCNGSCYVQDIFGNYITMHSKNYKQLTISRCKLINKNNNWRFAPSVSLTEVRGYRE